MGLYLLTQKLKFIFQKIGSFYKEWTYTKYHKYKTRLIKNLEEQLTKDYLNAADKSRIKKEILEIEKANNQKIKEIMNYEE